ncbi:MAG TPA: gamma-glutamyl-gamma-aminobutyrate hydrolase family protein [Longimicrobiaceae bacterium]|nr:gamma-glutamyl-gamma-aminobutyrate hydrolase family protein [Longimicrobiaceae bacterium]
MRPLIAVTTTRYAGKHRVPQLMLDDRYVQALDRAGATSLLLTPAHDARSMQRILDLAGGLVLTGGEDVDPARFGQEPHPTLQELCRERDEMEVRALEMALARGMPVIAICRGVQLLNVALGGTLYQDLPSQRGGDLKHEQEASVDEEWHEVRVEEGSRLAEALGDTRLRVNSFHHQAVDQVAPGLRPTAWADDGVVEGVEMPGREWVLGVQWHPERGWEEPDGASARLFRAFVAAAKG